MQTKDNYTMSKLFDKLSQLPVGNSSMLGGAFRRMVDRYARRPLSPVRYPGKTFLRADPKELRQLMRMGWSALATDSLIGLAKFSRHDSTHNSTLAKRTLQATKSVGSLVVKGFNAIMGSLADLASGRAVHDATVAGSDFAGSSLSHNQHTRKSFWFVKESHRGMHNTPWVAMSSLLSAAWKGMTTGNQMINNIQALSLKSQRAAKMRSDLHRYWYALK